MNTVTPAMRDLARRLVALEAARCVPGGEIVRVCEMLGGRIAKLAGVAGFRSLLTRALALAVTEEPWLKAVQVDANGVLQNLDEARRERDANAAGATETVIAAQLLGLLATFIGESLTLRLVRDTWPEAAVDETISDAGVQS